MGKWETKTLGEVCTLKSGTTVPKEIEQPVGDVPYLKVADMNLPENDSNIVTSSRFIFWHDLGKKMPFPVGTTIFPKRGGAIFTNKKRLTSVPICADLNIMGVIPSDVITPEFLYYYFLTVDMTELGSGASIPQINNYDISPLPIPLPPLSEQKQIVAILDEAFAAIETATANAQKNLENARELFESCLDGVFAKKGEGWVEKPLGEVCSFQGGSQPSKSEFSKDLKDGYVRLIQIRDYKSDKHTVYIPKVKARRFCSADDVMIGRYGPPLFQILRGIDGAYNVALMKAKPNEELINKDYLYFFLKNRSILQYIINASNRAAGQIGLNKATLEPYPIAFPSKDKQEKIVFCLEESLKKNQHLESIYTKKLTLLAELKQSILHRAFTGELTADSTTAERMMQEAGI